jgi:hypothetical protein
MNKGRFMAQYGNSDVLHKLIDEKNGDALLIAMEGAKWKDKPEERIPNPNLGKEHFQRIIREIDPVKNGTYLHDLANQKLKTK